MREFELLDVFYLALAMRWTIALTALALLGGGAIGLVLAALGVSRFWIGRQAAFVYVVVVQGIPLLAWLFLFYFGPALFGLTITPLVAASFGLSVYAGAFLGEIWRGALVSVPRGQWESGASIGLSYLEQLRYTIIPQAVIIAIPPTVGFIVQLVKNTSLAATVGLVELAREGEITTASTFRPLTVYLLIACYYFVMCYPLTRYSRFLERRLRIGR